MELAEPIERINYQLEKEFGKSFDNRPNYRVIWSEDQYEKRWVAHTQEGWELLTPRVEERPKYKQYIQEKWILEVLIPVIGQTELTENVSYEPLWPFMDHDGNYLPPRYDVCKIVIDQRHERMGRPSPIRKWNDPNSTPEGRQAALAKVEQELFGDETPVGDALYHDYGIVVPGPKDQNIAVPFPTKLQGGK